MRNFTSRSLVVAAALSAAAGVSSAALDVSAITAIGPDIASVGAAVFAMLVAIKAVKLVRRAL